MRKLLTIIYGIIIALSISSCSNEGDDYFGESSAQRLNRAVKEYTELLCSSESGWAMEYFANEKKKGYTLLIKFRETDGVTIAAKDDYTKNKYTEDKSLFKVINDNGPVLSFNTYNSLLHYFADPAGDSNSGNNGDGRGHEGDYEFIVMKASDNLIELQGKKRGYTIQLRRLPEGQDWEAYLKKLEDVKNSLFSTKIPFLWLTTSQGGRYTLTNAATGVFNAIPEGGDAISQTVELSYITEEKGIRLLKPFTGDKKAFSIQVFDIAEDGALTCVDDGTSRITAPAAPDFFCMEENWKNNNSWKLVPDKIGGKLKNQYDVTMMSCLAAYSATIDCSFKYNANVGGQSFSFTLKGKTSGSRGIKAAIDVNDPGQIHFTLGSFKDDNWNNIIKKVPELDILIELLTSNDYVVSSNSIMRPTTLKFTSATDTNDHFTVSLE